MLLLTLVNEKSCSPRVLVGDLYFKIKITLLLDKIFLLYDNILIYPVTSYKFWKIFTSIIFGVSGCTQKEIMSVAQLSYSRKHILIHSKQLQLAFDVVLYLRQNSFLFSIKKPMNFKSQHQLFS